MPDNILPIEPISAPIQSPAGLNNYSTSGPMSFPDPAIGAGMHTTPDPVLEGFSKMDEMKPDLSAPKFFDWEKNNTDKLKNSPHFKDLGIDPDLGPLNEMRYEQAQTFGDAAKEFGKSVIPGLSSGFSEMVDNWKNIGSWFNDPSLRDTFKMDQLEEINRKRTEFANQYPIFTGESPSWYASMFNSMQSVTPFLGSLAEIATETIAIKAIEGITFGAAAPGLEVLEAGHIAALEMADAGRVAEQVPAFTKNAIRATEIINNPSTIGKLFNNLSEVSQRLPGVGNTLGFGTGFIADIANKTSASAAATIGRGLGAFVNDLRSINVATAFASGNAASTYQELINGQIENYRKDNGGLDPGAGDVETMKQNALRAAKTDGAMNAYAMLFLEKAAFGNLLSSKAGAEAYLERNGYKDIGIKPFWAEDVIEAPLYTKQKFRWYDFKSNLLGNYGEGATNLATKGVEFGIFGNVMSGIDKGVKSYYEAKYNNDNLNFLTAIRVGVNDQFTSEGAKTFISGFLQGAILLGIGGAALGKLKDVAIEKGGDRWNKWTKSAEDYTSDKTERTRKQAEYEAGRSEFIDWMNKSFGSWEDPLNPIKDVFHGMVLQNMFETAGKSALATKGTIKDFHDINDDSTREFLLKMSKSGLADMWVDRMQKYSGMYNQDELCQMLNVPSTPENYQYIKGQIASLPGRLSDLMRISKSVEKVMGTPFNPYAKDPVTGKRLYKDGSEEFNIQANNKAIHDKAKDMLITMHDEAERKIVRQNEILNGKGDSEGIAGMPFAQTSNFSTIYSAMSPDTLDRDLYLADEELKATEKGKGKGTLSDKRDSIATYKESLEKYLSGLKAIYEKGAYPDRDQDIQKHRDKYRDQLTKDLHKYLDKSLLQVNLDGKVTQVRKPPTLQEVRDGIDKMMDYYDLGAEHNRLLDNLNFLLDPSIIKKYQMAFFTEGSRMQQEAMEKDNKEAEELKKERAKHISLIEKLNTPGEGTMSNKDELIKKAQDRIDEIDARLKKIGKFEPYTKPGGTPPPPPTEGTGTGTGEGYTDAELTAVKTDLRNWMTNLGDIAEAEAAGEIPSPVKLSVDARLYLDDNPELNKAVKTLMSQLSGIYRSGKDKDAEKMIDSLLSKHFDKAAEPLDFSHLKGSPKVIPVDNFYAISNDTSHTYPSILEANKALREKYREFEIQGRKFQVGQVLYNDEGVEYTLEGRNSLKSGRNSKVKTMTDDELMEYHETKPAPPEGKPVIPANRISADKVGEISEIYTTGYENSPQHKAVLQKAISDIPAEDLYDNLTLTVTRGPKAGSDIYSTEGPTYENTVIKDNPYVKFRRDDYTIMLHVKGVDGSIAYIIQSPYKNIYDFGNGPTFELPKDKFELVYSLGGKSLDDAYNKYQESFNKMQQLAKAIDQVTKLGGTLTGAKLEKVLKISVGKGSLDFTTERPTLEQVEATGKEVLAVVDRVEEKTLWGKFDKNTTPIPQEGLTGGKHLALIRLQNGNTSWVEMHTPEFTSTTSNEFNQFVSDNINTASKQVQEAKANPEEQEKILKIANDNLKSLFISQNPNLPVVVSFPHIRMMKSGYINVALKVERNIIMTDGTVERRQVLDENGKNPFHVTINAKPGSPLNFGTIKDGQVVPDGSKFVQRLEKEINDYFNKEAQQKLIGKLSEPIKIGMENIRKGYNVEKSGKLDHDTVMKSTINTTTDIVHNQKIDYSFPETGLPEQSIPLSKKSITKGIIDIPEKYKGINTEAQSRITENERNNYIAHLHGTILGNLNTYNKFIKNEVDNKPTPEGFDSWKSRADKIYDRTKSEYDSIVQSYKKSGRINFEVDSIIEDFNNIFNTKSQDNSLDEEVVPTNGQTQVTDLQMDFSNIENIKEYILSLSKDEIKKLIENQDIIQVNTIVPGEFYTFIKWSPNNKNVSMELVKATGKQKIVTEHSTYGGEGTKLSTWKENLFEPLTGHWKSGVTITAQDHHYSVYSIPKLKKEEGRPQDNSLDALLGDLTNISKLVHTGTPLEQKDIVDIEDFKNDIATNLPGFISVSDTLIPNLINGNMKIGEFVTHLGTVGDIKGVIRTSPGATDKYHEAFHSIYRMLLTPEEQHRLLAEAHSKNPVTSKKLETFRKAGYSYDPHEETDRLQEEWMADKFDEWKKNHKTVVPNSIREWFKKLWNFIKELFNRLTGNRIEAMFYKYNRQGFKYMKLQDNEFTTTANSSALKLIETGIEEYKKPDGTFVTLTKTLDQNTGVQLTNTIAAIYAMEKPTSTLSHEKLLDSILDNYKETLDPRKPRYTDIVKALHQKSPENARNFVNRLKEVFSVFNGEQGRKSLTEAIEQKLKLKNYTEDEEGNKDRSEFEKGKGSWEDSADMKGGYGTLLPSIREYIEQTVVEGTDEFGNSIMADGKPVYVSVDGQKVYNSLSQLLRNTPDRNVMINKMISARNNGDAGAVIRRLFADVQFSRQQGIWNVQKNPQLFQQFINGFRQASVDHITGELIKGTARAYSANRQDSAQKQVDIWAGAFDRMYLSGYQNTSAKKTYQKEHLKPLVKLRDFLTDTEHDFTDDNDFISKCQSLSNDFKEQLGISLDPLYIQYSIAYNKINKSDYMNELVATYNAPLINVADVSGIHTVLLKGDNPFLEGVTGATTRLNDIAAGNAVFDSDTDSTNYVDAEGKARHSMQKYNYLLEQTTKLNTDEEIERLCNDSDTSGSHLLSDNKWLNWDKKLAIVDGLSTGDGEGTVSKSWNTRETNAYPFTLYATPHEKDGVYGTWVIPIVVSDKSTMWMPSAPVIPSVYKDKAGKLRITDNAMDKLLSIVRDEIARIDRVKEEIDTLSEDKKIQGRHLADKNGVIKGLKFDRASAMLGELGKSYEEDLDKEKLKDYPVKQQIEKYFLSKDGTIAKYLEDELLESGLISKTGDKYINALLPDYLWDSLPNVKLNDGLNITNDFMHNVSQIYISNYLNAEGFMHLLFPYGTTVLGKNSMVKRISVANSAGDSAKTLFAAPELGINRPFTSFHIATISEPRDENGFEHADSQMYCTEEGMRYTRFGFGRLTQTQADMLNKISLGKPLTREEVFGTEGLIKNGDAFAPLKPAFFDGKTSVKCSLVMLSKDMLMVKDRTGKWIPDIRYKDTLYPMWKAMRDFETANDTVAFVSPESSFKTVIKNSAATTSDLSSDHFHEFDTDNLRDQVYLPSNSTSMTKPTQPIWNLMAEQDDKTPVYNTTIGEIKRQYGEAVSNRLRANWNNALNAMFELTNGQPFTVDTQVDHNNIRVKLGAFYDQMRENLQSTGADEQILGFLEVRDGEPVFPALDFPSTLEKYTNMVMKYFSKVMNESVPGISATKMSSFGIPIIRQIHEVDNDGVPVTGKWTVIGGIEYRKDPEKYQNAKSYTDSDKRSFSGLKAGDYVIDHLRANVPEFDKEGKPTGIRYNEYIFPIHHLEDDGSQDSPIAMGYRNDIPYADKNSGAVFKRVDTLPIHLGSVQVNPSVQSQAGGKDHDADKDFLQIMDTYVQDGKLVSYGTATTIKGKFNEFVQWNRKNNPIVKNYERDAMAEDEEVQEIKKDLINLKVSNEYIVGKLIGMIDLPRPIAGIRGARAELLKQHKTQAKTVEGLEKQLMEINAVYILQALDEAKLPYREADFISRGGEDLNVGVQNNRELKAKIALAGNDNVTGGDNPINLRPTSTSLLSDLVKPDNGNSFFTLLTRYKEDHPELNESALKNIDELLTMFQESGANLNEMRGISISQRSVSAGKNSVGVSANGVPTLSFFMTHRVPITGPHITFNGVSYTHLGGSNATNGIRKFEVLMSYINTMTDNAKLELASKLGLSVDALADAMTMTASGMNVDDVQLYLLQPEVRKYYKSIAYIKGSLKTSAEENSNKVSVLKEMIDSYGSRKPHELSRADLEKGLVGQPSDEQELEEYLHSQLSALVDIQKAQKIGSQIFQTSRVTALAGGLPSTWEGYDNWNNAYEELGIKDGKVVDDHKGAIDVAHALLRDPITSTYIKQFTQLGKLGPELFLQRSWGFKTLLSKQLEEYRKIGNSENEAKISKQMIHDIISHLSILALMRKPGWGNINNGLIYTTLQGERITDVYKRLRDMKGKNKNYFINDFIRPVFAGQLDNKSKVDKLLSNNWAKLSDSRQLQIRDSFMEGYNNPKTHDDFETIFKYLLVKDGGQFRNGSFIKFIAPALFKDLYDSTADVKKALADVNFGDEGSMKLFGQTWDEVMEDYVANYSIHPDNTKYLRRDKMKDGEIVPGSKFLNVPTRGATGTYRAGGATFDILPLTSRLLSNYAIPEKVPQLPYSPDSKVEPKEKEITTKVQEQTSVETPVTKQLFEKHGILIQNVGGKATAYKDGQPLQLPTDVKTPKDLLGYLERQSVQGTDYDEGEGYNEDALAEMAVKAALKRQGNIVSSTSMQQDLFSQKPQVSTGIQNPYPGVENIPDTGLSVQQANQFIDLLQPQILNQAYVENKAYTANRMFSFGLRWAKNVPNETEKSVQRQEGLKQRPGKVPIKAPSKYDGYGYYSTDQNNKPIPSVKTLQPIIDFIQSKLGIDMKNYDSVLANIYESGSFIHQHRDITESTSAKNYPVIVINLGAEGNLLYHTDFSDESKHDLNANTYSQFEMNKSAHAELPIKNGGVYAFGVGGVNRFTFNHRVSEKTQNTATKPIKVPEWDSNGNKIGEKTLTNYRITLTFRRAQDLTTEPKSPERQQPVVPSQQATDEEVQQKLRDCKK